MIESFEKRQKLPIFAFAASRNYVHDAPPPYTPPSGAWYLAPPPAYSADPNGYGGWVPPTNVFPEQPPRKQSKNVKNSQTLNPCFPANSVYMTESPPPYPGINGYSGYATANGAGGFTVPGGAAGGASAPNMTSAEAKAAEAAQVQTGYVDPNNPTTAFIPPNDLPPSYDESTKKNN